MPATDRRVALAPDFDRLDERSARAWRERMAVTPLGDGRYRVESEHGTYVVDLPDNDCTCPDQTYRHQRCKHLRRVAIEVTTGRVPPPGRREVGCDACGTAFLAGEDAVPPFLCADCHVERGDAVSDRETGDLLVVTAVRPERASEAAVPGTDHTVATYPTNEGYPATDPVVEAVYAGDLARREDPTRYAFPRSRLRRRDDVRVPRAPPRDPETDGGGPPLSA